MMIGTAEMSTKKPKNARKPAQTTIVSDECLPRGPRLSTAPGARPPDWCTDACASDALL